MRRRRQEDGEEEKDEEEEKDGEDGRGHQITRKLSTSSLCTSLLSMKTYPSEI